MLSVKYIREIYVVLLVGGTNKVFYVKYQSTIVIHMNYGTYNYLFILPAF